MNKMNKLTKEFKYSIFLFYEIFDFLFLNEDLDAVLLIILSPLKR